MPSGKTEGLSLEPWKIPVSALLQSSVQEAGTSTLDFARKDAAKGSDPCRWKKLNVA
jgi:hypothetical protein